ncbi:hypothetical protein EMMF5_001933 [Cystobasidiomycetes sp. EMM_F5]
MATLRLNTDYRAANEYSPVTPVASKPVDYALLEASAVMPTGLTQQQQQTPMQGHVSAFRNEYATISRDHAPRRMARSSIHSQSAIEPLVSQAFPSSQPMEMDLQTYPASAPASAFPCAVEYGNAYSFTSESASSESSTGPLTPPIAAPGFESVDSFSQMANKVFQAAHSSNTHRSSVSSISSVSAPPALGGEMDPNQAFPSYPSITGAVYAQYAPNAYQQQHYGYVTPYEVSPAVLQSSDITVDEVAIALIQAYNQGYQVAAANTMAPMQQTYQELLGAPHLSFGSTGVTPTGLLAYQEYAPTQLHLHAPVAIPAPQPPALASYTSPSPVTSSQPGSPASAYSSDESSLTNRSVVSVDSNVSKHRTGGKTSLSEKSKRFSCSYPGCKRAFSRNFNLTTHYNTHLGVKPYPCSHCPKSFSRRHDCARHIAAVHATEIKMDCSCGCAQHSMDGSEKQSAANIAAVHCALTKPDATVEGGSMSYLDDLLNSNLFNSNTCTTYPGHQKVNGAGAIDQAQLGHLSKQEAD